jgi:hypothetical protein
MQRRTYWVGAAALLGAMACQDLAVQNPNEPDRERATKQPVSAESFVASSFRTWWPVAGHDDYPAWAFSTMANEVTSGFADFGQLEVSTEPRSGWNNSPVNARNQVSEGPWYGLYGAISAVNDALIAIDSGLVVVDAQRTSRTRAVGKFIQGVSHEYLAFYFDSAVVTDERLALDTISTPTFQGYADVSKAAIAQLDSAIVIANRGPDFTLPVDSWLFQAMTRAQFVRLVNSFAAKALAQTPSRSRTFCGTTGSGWWRASAPGRRATMAGRATGCWAPRTLRRGS